MVQVDDVWAFALDQRLFGQQVINTFAMRITQTPGGVTEQQFIEGMFHSAGQGVLKNAGLAETLSDMQTVEVTYLQWLVARVGVNPTNTFNVAAIGILGGTAAGTCETANVSQCITRKGLDKGRRNKGRVAVAGLATTRYAAGIFDNNAMAVAAAFAQNLHVQVSDNLGNVADMGFWSPVHTAIVDGVPKEYPSKWTKCIDAYAQKTVRVQRSRTVGVGR